MQKLTLTLVVLAALQSGAARANDYPTAARADYVFACMASNGQTQEALQRCSCSIDVIASIVPYKRYVEAETILRMRQVSGEKSATFRDSAEYRKIVDDLKGAQAEAEIRCF
ncbi:MAG: hypothetical protein OEU09_06175 [Rhodospirillales bacterium]|nr:hypothetical protein [Rhodospirillales bacterium]MDH3910866.1 hypothetical protein [Rhodospirillales bacterium]MDH3918874.1 hypothetical protein [Rhodospirillales bacterium]MDH3970050.1 hypothetical protein [Rhodospirillales bacterium]